jgi:hypothetical protein
LSPRIKLVLYPDGDPAFQSHITISVNIELPNVYSALEVVAAVQEHLRQRYPLATIHTDGPPVGEYDETWHVYRDGPPDIAPA